MKNLHVYKFRNCGFNNYHIIGVYPNGGMTKYRIFRVCRECGTDCAGYDVNHRYKRGGGWLAIGYYYKFNSGEQFYYSKHSKTKKILIDFLKNKFKKSVDNWGV